MKETEAHNVPTRTDKKPLDVEKYKHLLKLSSESDSDEVHVEAHRPQLHRPVEQQGIKVMSRVQDVNCPHCGGAVGAWSFFHRLAASEELEEQVVQANLMKEKEDLEGRLNGINEILASEDVVKKYEKMYNELNSE
jgi:hypothetical protein